MPDGLRLALTTLTVAPVRGPREISRRTAGTAMVLAPLVGLGLGVAAALVLYAFRLLGDFRVEPLLPCAMAVAALALLTRGLHLDGLVDTVDGLSSYRDPEGTRAVMKAPDAGPLGVAALVLVLLVQVLALESSVVHGRGTASLVLAVVVGRLAVTAACCRTPAATPEGLGALVARTVKRGTTTALVVPLCAVAGWYATQDRDTVGPDSEQVLRTVAAVLLPLLLCRLVRAHAVRRVGGLTGDVLGALCELATTASLVVLASSFS